MHRSVAQLLKEQTAGTHAHVEAGLGLLEAELSVARLRTVLARFIGFWQGNERGLDAWATARPAAAEQLCWPRRRRGEVLRQDLLRLGLTVRDLAELPEAPPVFAYPGDAEVLGWLYVSEGSTLGGAVIARALRSLPDRAAQGLRTFTPYLEGPGPMWRAYLAYLTEWVGQDVSRRGAVTAAGCHAFAALADWLEPVSVGIAA